LKVCGECSPDFSFKKGLTRQALKGRFSTMASSTNGSKIPPAYIVTGPTSGIGRATVFELAKQGTVLLVGRDLVKLNKVRKTIEGKGQRAVTVVCDLSDLQSVQRAAAEIIGLRLPIAGMLNNAGVFPHTAKRPNLYDTAFVTNHLGPFLLTETLLPHLPDGANVLFVASGVEDPKRKPAVAAGFRGGRFISVEASSRGEWKPGGSTMPGADAYATSKQCILAAALEFARENPRLHINAVEPGFTPATGLARDAPLLARFLLKYVLTLFAPFIKYWSTPQRAGRMIAHILVDNADQSGVYYDDGGHPMLGSAEVQDPKFRSRVVAETRALLVTIPGLAAGNSV
jgi:NAD(P)-dependent dehydrogenase (short-subunit alcohol dehydrogenase family)